MKQEVVEMITTPQIRKIWYEAKQLGLTDDDMHEMISSEFRVDSVKKLTKSEAIYLIDVLVKYTGNSKHRPGMATPMQLWRIEELRKQLGWEPNGIKGFIKKNAHVEDIKWLTDKAASGIITGLTRVLKYREKANSKEAGGGSSE